TLLLGFGWFRLERRAVGECHLVDRVESAVAQVELLLDGRIVVEAAKEQPEQLRDQVERLPFVEAECIDVFGKLAQHWQGDWSEPLIDHDARCLHTAEEAGAGAPGPTGFLHEQLDRLVRRPAPDEVERPITWFAFPSRPKPHSGRPRRLLL